MRVVLAAPRSATAPTARIDNSGLQATAVRRSTHRRVAATICSATASSSIHPRHRRATTRTPRPRRPNPHSDRGTAARSPQRGFLVWGFVKEEFQRATRRPFFLREFLCSIEKPVSSSRPTLRSRRRAQKLSRLAAAPTLRHAPPLPGHNLDSFEHDGTLGAIGMTIRGEPAFGRGSIAPQPCIRWVQEPEP